MLALISRAVSEKKSLKLVDDGRTPDHGCSKSILCVYH